MWFTIYQSLKWKAYLNVFFSYPSSKGFDIFLTWLWQVVPVKNGKPADEDDDSADEDMDSEEDEKVWS